MQVLSELVRRLAAYYAAAEGGVPPPGEGPVAVSFEDPLPLDDFFEVGKGNKRHMLS